MSGFARVQVGDSLGKARDARVGDGFLSALRIVSNSQDSNQTIPASSLAGGVYRRAGMTAGRTDTTDTAANILAQFSNMDVGDTFTFAISVNVAFALTLAAGTGVTLAGKTSVAASGFGLFVLEKTSSTTVTITGL